MTMWLKPVVWNTVSAVSVRRVKGVFPDPEETGRVVNANLAVCWVAWQSSTLHCSTTPAPQKATSRISGGLWMFSNCLLLIRGDVSVEVLILLTTMKLCVANRLA